MEWNWTHLAIEVVSYSFFLLMIFHAWFETDAIKLLDATDSNDDPSARTRPGLSGLLLTLLSGVPANFTQQLGGSAHLQLNESDRDNRSRWLSTLLVGALFGVAIEFVLISKANSHQTHPYEYGPFLVMLPNPFSEANPVPLWVGLGWGAILYATTWTAQRLKRTTTIQALLAGLLAVNIDISLDPIAQALGFWDWHIENDAPTYYKVPFDNFICWLTIVFTYSLLVRKLFMWFGKVRGSTAWVPFLGAALSLLAVTMIDSGLPFVYGFVGGEATVFVAVFIVSSLIVAFWAGRPTRDLTLSWDVVAIPLVLHSLCYGLLLATGKYKIGESSSLLVTIPLALLLGMVGYTWGSWEHIVPRKPPPSGRSH
jgi:uncharacterized membrane protein